LRLDVNYVIKNIKNVIKDFKEACLLVDDNIEIELIISANIFGFTLFPLIK
jgi:hypothetical protein